MSIKQRVTTLLLLILLPGVSLGQTVIQGFRTNDKTDSTRFVLDLSENPKYEIFTLPNPARVVIDVRNAKWGDFSGTHNETRRIKGVRYSAKDSNSTRIVLDVNQPVKVQKVTIIEPTNYQYYRMVVDLEPESEFLDVTSIPVPVSKHGLELGIPIPHLKERYKPVIVIDAGHGGRDPGTIGRKGTQEKILTLQYARELKAELDATGKYETHLTRDEDVFIPLQERVTIAHKLKGDLFISVHANSHDNNQISGFSVFTLSERASDKEAEALANKENTAGIIGNVDLSSENDDVTELLIDLVQRDAKNRSASFAELLINDLQHEVDLLRNPHRFAGFRVLTGADIPSVLIEVGYLTNKKEEKLLNSENHKKKLAKTIVKAIDTHFTNYEIDG